MKKSTEEELQQSEVKSVKRVMKNTAVLYFRQIITLLVNLYTVRMVLSVLGHEDYGIYQVVGGVITTFGFLSSTLASATQRFFSVQLAKRDAEKLKKVFCLSFSVCIIIAVGVLLLGETIGLWFVTTHLVIPEARMNSAIFVYQATVISFIFSVITSVYMADIIAHENMNIYAYVSIIEVVLKLLIVYVLQIVESDKLKVYSILLCAVSIIVTSIYVLYCRRSYKEARIKWLWDKQLFKEINAYMGWNMLGTISWTLRGSGISIILNLFFNPLINAAYGIAGQVNSAITSFYSNFTTAYRPQIVKTYNADRHSECMDLLFKATKISYFLMLIMGLPVMLEAPFILEIWLKDVPEHSVMFVRLMIVAALIEAISQGLIALMSAQGRLKEYQLVVSGITLMSLPLSWIVLRWGFVPESVSVVMIGIAAASLIARIIMLGWLANLPIRKYIVYVIVPIVGMTLTSAIIPAWLTSLMDYDWKGFLVVGCSCVICVSLSMWFICMSESERKGAAAMLIEKFRRKGRRNE